MANDVYRLRSATGDVGTRDGRLDAKYDDAGYMVGLIVRRNGPCLPAAAICSQRFVYDWDETGRLARARRWDEVAPGSASDPVPGQAPEAELRYAYDGGDDRTLKTSVDAQGNERHTVYIFATLELRRAKFETGEYERTAWTEVPYLFAHGVRVGRVHYSTESAPTLTSGQRHVLLEIPDYLGSSATLVDKGTSELVERSTYQGYGATESDYRPERWEGVREDYKFTGKEEDVELGVQYFGKRYLAPLLGRWMSADPLAVHAGGGDLNAYAYVHGTVFRAIDAVGLADTPAHKAPEVESVQTPEGYPGAAVWVSAPTNSKGADSIAQYRSLDEARAAAARIPGAVLFYHTRNLDKLSIERMRDDLLRVYNQSADAPDHGGTVRSRTGGAGSGHGPKGGTGEMTELDASVALVGAAADPIGGFTKSLSKDEGKSGGVPDGANANATGSELGQAAYLVVQAIKLAIAVAGVAMAAAGRGAMANPWTKAAEFKYDSYDRLSKAEQKLANVMVDRFRQRFLDGLGDKMVNIRNCRNLGDGLWELKSAQGVRVYINNDGHVLAYGNKATQAADIPFVKKLLSAF